jgi:hypothetical protein
MIKLTSLLNESFHPELQQFIQAIELLDKAGAINDDFFRTIRTKLDSNLRAAVDKAKVDKKDKILYQKMIDKISAPIKRMNSAKELIAYAKKLGSQQTLDESIISEIDFRGMVQKIKKAIKGAGHSIKAWWNEYGEDFALGVLQFLIDLILNILLAFITGGKSSGRKFGGGSFGGGGAGGKW